MKRLMLLALLVLSAGCMTPTETPSATPTTTATATSTPEPSSMRVIDKDRVAGKTMVVFHDEKRKVVCYLYTTRFSRGDEASASASMSCLPVHQVAGPIA